MKVFISLRIFLAYGTKVCFVVEVIELIVDWMKYKMDEIKLE